ncbi:MAG: M14 family metallopeptidase [Patescibacteria group bacterium]|nr:M14 family metallopeptidase [Patescibacteria group bacterium]
MKRIVAILIILIILGGLIFYIIKSGSEKEIIIEPVESDLTPKHEVIGSSVGGREIETYTYGKGEERLLFVGGIHGGYEWNSVLLAYKFIDYLKINPDIIPDNLSITIIPSANPDGIYKVTNKEGLFTIADIPDSDATVPGRFNANEVDLNRNFDCKWQPKSTWRGETVSAGSQAFSEPEAKAIRNFVLENNPEAVIFWHSQANAVYASECENGVLPETLNIMNVYSDASGYTPVETFDSYEVTGDAEGWLASINIPAITVELKNHQEIDWEENLAGVKALFKYYEQENNTPINNYPLDNDQL